MKKHKIKSLAKYADLHEEIKLVGKDGTEVMVRTHIPYNEKLELAENMVEAIFMIHDDSCWYLHFEERAIKAKLIVDKYTDLDVDDVSPGPIMDFLINNELYEKLFDAIEEDLNVVENMFVSMQEAVGYTFDDDRSLSKAIRTSFGFLFNGEDITSSLAKAEMTQNTLLDAFSALKKVEQERATQIDNGSLNIDGNIIHFGKKG